jgi:hypothetical protein
MPLRCLDRLTAGFCAAIIGSRRDACNNLLEGDSRTKVSARVLQA